MHKILKSKDQTVTSVKNIKYTGMIDRKCSKKHAGGLLKRQFHQNLLKKTKGYRSNNPNHAKARTIRVTFKTRLWLSISNSFGAGKLSEKLFACPRKLSM